jgi:hypothetical protein
MLMPFPTFCLWDILIFRTANIFCFWTFDVDWRTGEIREASGVLDCRISDAQKKLSIASSGQLYNPTQLLSLLLIFWLGTRTTNTYGKIFLQREERNSWI